MKQLQSDRGAGDVNYGHVGHAYSRYRKPEAAIATQILEALGDANTVLNVGAGAGSYEPTDRKVTAVEPSAAMRAQRHPDLSPAIDAMAENLPFPDASFDASMATVTVHQWLDLEKGITEMRRVTRSNIVLLVGDPTLITDFWLYDYVPEIREIELSGFPPIERILAALGPNVTVHSVPIPLNCSDGFNEAYYGRPEALLDPDARLACSSWGLISETVTERFVNRLSEDLANGQWDVKYGHLRSQAFWDGPLRLLIRRHR